MTQTKSVDELLAEMGISQADYERQCQLEMDGFEMGRQRYMDRYETAKKDPNRDITLFKPESRRLHVYHEIVAKEIGCRMLTSRGGSSRTKELRKQLVPLGQDRMAYLALRFALNIKETSLTDCCVKLGGQIQRDLEYFWFQELAPAYLSKVESRIKSAHIGYRHNVLRHAANKIELVQEDGITRVKGIPSAHWDMEDKFLVGKILLEIIEQKTNLIQRKSATKRINVSSAKYGFINIQGITLEQTPECLELLRNEHSDLADMSPVFFPSVIPPKPWQGVRGGGFWTEYRGLGTKILRTYNRKALKNASEHGVDLVCATLNKIQSTPYRINKRVLDVMIEAAPAGLGQLPPPEQGRIEIDGWFPLETPMPWDDAEFKRRKAASDPEYLRIMTGRAKAWDHWYREQSKRSALAWKLRIAKQFKDEPRIYFSWNLDYRGRVYCYQPYINPQMDDSGKALIEFAEGKALGETGARWLMIHGANEFGFDKAPLDQRVQWVRDHEAQILESAENPLDGQRFWCEAEKPFVFLAFCFEYAGYKREGNAFVSHLPVQVDGTCSGLQHFSALLRDRRGGAAVNLVPQPEKADVYAQVAQVVNDLLNQDKDKGGDEGKFARAWLAQGVDRKIVKRNVMTFCYGATKPGFAQQLIDDVEKKPEGVEEFKACAYLAGLNWRAVEMTLVKSVEAMTFMQKVAFFVASNGNDIQWTTPVGLRVTQDYLKSESKMIETWWGGVRIQPRVSHETDEKNATGSRNGISPNFIHSLDAAHLMLTTGKCWAEGIRAFSYIHDSFGTHAADMEIMSRVLRETFIEMYSEDLLAKWVADVRAMLPAELLPEFDKIIVEFKPSMGDLDLTQVQRSAYFFS